jgi:hypothetical protein
MNAPSDYTPPAPRHRTQIDARAEVKSCAEKNALIWSKSERDAWATAIRQLEVTFALSDALFDLFDGNTDVARTIAYDTGLPAERVAEIAEMVERARASRQP